MQPTKQPRLRSTVTFINTCDMFNGNTGTAIMSSFMEKIQIKLYI